MVVVALPFLGRISEAFPPPLNYILVAAIILLIFMVGAVQREEGWKKRKAMEARPRQRSLTAQSDLKRLDNDRGIISQTESSSLQRDMR